MSDNIKNLLEKQRDYFSKGETKNITFRLNALKILKAAIKEKKRYHGCLA